MKLCSSALYWSIGYLCFWNGVECLLYSNPGSIYERFKKNFKQPDATHRNQMGAQQNFKTDKVMVKLSQKEKLDLIKKRLGEAIARFTFIPHFYFSFSSS